MTNNLKPIEKIESKADSSKSSKIIENTKNVARKALTTVWIAASTMWPVAATSTTIPTTINTIIAVNPSEISPAARAISLWTAAELANSLDKQHQSIEIKNIKPVDILPIIWQIETWDKNAYDHIEHLRVAEATRIRDMMWKYGAGNYSAEEYQELMNRLNTGMRWEIPLWYDNYEVVWDSQTTPTSHAHNQRHILNSLIKHANFKTVWQQPDKSRQQNLLEFIKNDPNSINIFRCSSYGDAFNKTDYENRLLKQDILDLCDSKNFIIFTAGTNIERDNWIRINKIYNWEYETDWHWSYSLASLANSDKNNYPNSHLFVTIGTNAAWDINQTNENVQSSKFPVWFDDNALFSWRAFPYKDYKSWKIVAEWWWINHWKYSTSYTWPLNACMADLCFQMKADVADVDELLEMIRSTALTDYIRFDLNGDWDTDDNIDGQSESQPLQLMNPAWFFQEYLMPRDLPFSLDINGTADLDKWFYHGVVFQIPGAEVNIDGQWVSFTNDNKDLILAQNPMTLKWRLNGALLKNNYKPWDTIDGQIIVVDDKWSGLNMSKDFSVSIDGEIVPSKTDEKIISTSGSDIWHTIDGLRLEEKPSKPGTYIVNGEKVII